MPKKIPLEFLYQLFSLLTVFILVHGAFVTIIRPEAEKFLEEEKRLMAVDPEYEQQRNFYVVLKDYEQEACLVLMMWALAILGFKGVSLHRQRRQLEEDLLQLPPSLPLGPEDAVAVEQRIQELSGKQETFLLSRALDAAIRRFGATHNVQDAATALRDVCNSEGERLEAELSIIRYIAWAIPSVGFIGTVRGIGAALSLADRAVEGDISGVTQYLGVAFNSTFIALIISIFLMFFIHQVQLLQDRLVLDTEQYCDRNLISRLRGPRPH